MSGGDAGESTRRPHVGASRHAHRAESVPIRGSWDSGCSDGYFLSKSIYDLRTSTRAPYVFAAPVRCRKVVYPGGCTARPGS